MAPKLAGAPEANCGAAPVWLRWIVRFRCPLTAALDDALAAGADPWTDRALMARAGVLCSARHRKRLADALDALVTVSEFPKLTSRSLRLDIDAIRHQRRWLEALAERLRAPSPVDVAALATLTRLVWRRESPVFVDGPRGDDLAAALADCVAVVFAPRRA